LNPLITIYYWKKNVVVYYKDIVIQFCIFDKHNKGFELKKFNMNGINNWNNRLYKLILLLSILFLVNCDRSEDLHEDLIQTDHKFSEYSKQHGMKAAFLHFCAEDAVLLRSRHNPVEGKKNISAHLVQIEDKNFTLSWEPQFAKVSRSGELGFTYGIYELHSKGMDDIELLGTGTYVSIWEKDKDGQWKYLLDSGNEGLDRDRLLLDIQNLKVITGRWYCNTKNGIIYENWENQGDTTLKGFSFLFKDGDKAYFENTHIEIIDNRIVYTAGPSNQNKGEDIAFELSKKEKDRYVFFNPEHDHPPPYI